MFQPVAIPNFGVAKEIQVYALNSGLPGGSAAAATGSQCCPPSRVRYIFFLGPAAKPFRSSMKQTLNTGEGRCGSLRQLRPASVVCHKPLVVTIQPRPSLRKNRESGGSSRLIICQ